MFLNQLRLLLMIIIQMFLNQICFLFLLTGHTRSWSLHFRLLIFGASNWLVGRLCLERIMGSLRFTIIPRERKNISMGINGKIQFKFKPNNWQALNRSLLILKTSSLTYFSFQSHRLIYKYNYFPTTNSSYSSIIFFLSYITNNSWN